jgi:hypothetical protein
MTRTCHVDPHHRASSWQGAARTDTTLCRGMSSQTSRVRRGGNPDALTCDDPSLLDRQTADPRSGSAGRPASQPSASSFPSLWWCALCSLSSSPPTARRSTPTRAAAGRTSWLARTSVPIHRWLPGRRCSLTTSSPRPSRCLQGWRRSPPLTRDCLRTASSCVLVSLG